MTRIRSASLVQHSGSSEALTSSSTLVAFHHGTGHSVYKDLLLPSILNAQYEIVLATCFWATSDTLNGLVSTLRQLSTRATERSRTSTIKVYICFSSLSATQKLFHTSSTNGHVYTADKWPTKLGLPSPAELPGLDITVKSLFFRPFSVLHSKYLIVDRETVFLPSCNVSWEDWYECAVGLEGPIVRDTFEFWKEIWKPTGLIKFPPPELAQGQSNGSSSINAPTKHLHGQLVQTTLLPHPHNASLWQALWFFPQCGSPLPRSPLNMKLLHLITHAEKEVVMLTPNFTSTAAFTAICFALSAGVHVHLITDRRMMVPEQLATAGVITEKRVDSLIKHYRNGLCSRVLQTRMTKLGELVGKDWSRQPSAIGRLKISYFHQPIRESLLPADEESASLQSRTDVEIGIASQATKSHIKLTLIDRKAIILGSGNMDRASWRTSQELGVLIEDRQESDQTTSLAEMMWTQIENGLEGCLESYFAG